MTTRVTVEVPASANYKCVVFESLSVEDDSSITVQTCSGTVMPGKSTTFHIWGTRSLFIKEQPLN